MRIGIAVQRIPDIVGATRRSPCDCPVARAINRRFGVLSNGISEGAFVSGAEASLYAGNAEAVIGLPPEAEAWIVQYDKGEFPEPFTFTVIVPTWLASRAQPVPELTA